MWKNMAIHVQHLAQSTIHFREQCTLAMLPLGWHKLSLRRLGNEIKESESQDLLRLRFLNLSAPQKILEGLSNQIPGPPTTELRLGVSGLELGPCTSPKFPADAMLLTSGTTELGPACHAGAFCQENTWHQGPSCLHRDQGGHPWTALRDLHSVYL